MSPPADHFQVYILIVQRALTGNTSSSILLLVLGTCPWIKGNTITFLVMLALESFTLSWSESQHSQPSKEHEFKKMILKLKWNLLSFPLYFFSSSFTRDNVSLDVSDWWTQTKPTLHAGALPEYWGDLCERQGRSVWWLRHGAGNHQSSGSPVPWEGILGNENDELACGANVMYCCRNIAYCAHSSSVRTRPSDTGQLRRCTTTLNVGRQQGQQRRFKNGISMLNFFLIKSSQFSKPVPNKKTKHLNYKKE